MADIKPDHAGAIPGDAVASASTVGRPAGDIRRDAREHSRWLLVVLGLLMGFGPIATDIYLPAIPSMTHALAASNGSIELTLSGYLIGFSFGQLLWGPVGDRYGRKRPIAAGLLLFVIGSAGCGLAGTASQLVGWRVVQAVGACAAPVLARATVRDLFAQERAAQMLSTLMTVMALAPLLGPIVGGQILAFASWRAIFYLLVVIGIVASIALLTIPESLPTDQRNSTGIRAALVSYAELVRERRLLGYALTGAFFYAGAYAYIAGTPAAYISFYHVSPQLYGVLFALGVLGIMATNMINTRAVPRLGSDRVLRLGAVGAALMGLWSAIAGRTGWGGLPGLVVPLFLYMAMSGLIVANSIAGALQAHPRRAGAASALVGAIHYGSGILTTAMVGWFADGTPWPMGWIMAAGGMGAALVSWRMIRREQSPVGGPSHPIVDSLDAT